jgi:hypothetical protein
MPTPTYTPLATVTLGTNAATVTFSSIPVTYRDLVVVAHCNTGTNVDAFLYFNSDTTEANYRFVSMQGDGSSAASVASNLPNWGFIGTTRGVLISHIMDYSATDKHKTTLTRNNFSANTVRAFARRWANTAAITTVQLNANAQSWQTGSTFALYGIAS